MFQLLKDPNYDFMGRAKMLLGVSGVLCLVAIGVLFAVGLNKGIEFTGGTELQLKYAHSPDLTSIRSTLSGAGIESPIVTTIGEPAENEVYIRIGTASGDDDPDEIVSRVTHALRGGDSSHDLNVMDQPTLERLLMDAPGIDPDQASRIAATISSARKEKAIFASVDDLTGLAGMTPELISYVGSNAQVGEIALRSQSYIGPAIGRELMGKAQKAILFSLVGMLLYIWLRFKGVQWGFAAVAALAHDTIITLGLFAISGLDLTLPVVAAFLTLVGYSVNDTVVVFDRIRENLENRPGRGLSDTINLSINQTLSRTIITSGLTWIVVFGLYVFGGAALKPFAFVLSVGVVVGTYSSIYIACPLLVLLRRTPAGAAAAVASARPRRT